MTAVIVHTYDLREEPVGPVYRALVAAADEVCDAFLLVRRHETTDESALGVIEHLSPWLIEESEASGWPGTDLLGHTATVYKFKATAETLAFLAQRVDRLYAWRQPDLPEDLCLLRAADGSPWLATIAHEADGFLMLSEAEREDLITRAPGLDFN